MYLPMEMEGKMQYGKAPEPINLVTKFTVGSLDFGGSCILNLGVHKNLD